MTDQRPMSPDKRRQLETLERFVAVYCRQKHGPDAQPRAAESLCPACEDLLRYAAERLAKCPLEPKPKCKSCRIHCYRGDYRERIRDVMKFAGMYFVKRGRIDWLIRYMLK